MRLFFSGLAIIYICVFVGVLWHLFKPIRDKNAALIKSMFEEAERERENYKRELFRTTKKIQKEVKKL